MADPDVPEAGVREPLAQLQGAAGVAAHDRVGAALPDRRDAVGAQPPRELGLLERVHAGGAAAAACVAQLDDLGRDLCGEAARLVDARPGRGAGGRDRRRRAGTGARREARGLGARGDRLGEVDARARARARAALRRSRPRSTRSACRPGTRRASPSRMRSPSASSPLCRCSAPQQPWPGARDDVVAAGGEQVDGRLLGGCERVLHDAAAQHGGARRTGAPALPADRAAADRSRAPSRRAAPGVERREGAARRARTRRPGPGGGRRRASRRPCASA